MKITKRHKKSSRSAALVEVPRHIADLLTLANMLPIEMRYPYWARREQSGGEKLKLAQYHHDIVHAPSMGMGHASIWYRLSSALEELPLTLQAFLLRDEWGEIYVSSDLQIERNFQLLGKTEGELKEVVKTSLEKMQKAVRYEEGKANERPRVLTPETFPTSESLVTRVRLRLIFVMAAQELLSCLTHPDKQEQLNRTTITHHSDATHSRPYVNSEGKFALLPPVLFSRLEGTEVSRIKECAICYRIFWAGRKDMRCCSTKCSHILRSRKYRETYKEKYAYQRYLKDETEKKQTTYSKKSSR